MQKNTGLDAVAKKTEGQYMTPDWIVSMILDVIGYTGEHILYKTIMEPSFGDGAFLAEIVQRIITEGRKRGFSDVEIEDVINNQVYGIEKDERLYNRALERLNDLLNANRMRSMTWNSLLCADTLKVYKVYKGAMDYVVGNPPYVRIHYIPDEYRETMKEFRFADGIFDLYVIFYEIGLSMLHETGKLGYISPNSFIRNISQQTFRNYLIENKYISALYDFKTSRIFEDAGTYTCICMLDKDGKRADTSIGYKEFSMDQVVAENRFGYEYFRNELWDKAWNLSSDDDIRFLEKNQGLPITVQNKAVVQNGIVTNKDTVYMVRAYTDKELTIPYMGKHTDEERTVYFRDKGGTAHPIELTILHRCVKASRYQGMMENTYIVFPYERVPEPRYVTRDGREIDSGYQPLTEEKMRDAFPIAYEYLSAWKEELMTRNMDKNTVWFLFGRSQGLQNCGYRKVVFKHIINKAVPEVKPYIVDEDVIVYSRMYTTVDVNAVLTQQKSTYIFNEEEYESALKAICDVFASEDFARYCAMVGNDIAGGYVWVSTRMVKQFCPIGSKV